MPKTNQAIMQDMQIYFEPQDIVSSVTLVECYVCGKGLQDNTNITAKTLASGTVLFCDIHYPLE